MESYIKRTAEQTLLRYLKAFPVTGLTGPRQSGKTTMLKSILKDSYRYVSFDSPVKVAEFRDDPERFMRIYHDKVIFDEAQKVPEIFSYVKIAVDNDRENYGKFILTGSSQFMLLKNISESLAGRIGLLSLLPLQFREVPHELREQSVFKGAFPEMVKRNYLFNSEWYQSYIDTYIEKDVRSISNIGNIRDFYRLIQLLAARCSQLINFSQLANNLGVSVNTVKSWISVLEASYIIFLVGPFYENQGKRITKSPKIYFYDTGLVSYLTGIETAAQFENSTMSGPLFENYVISEVKKIAEHNKTFSELYFLRTSNGAEVDLIIDRRSAKEWIEIKRGETFTLKMISHIYKFKRPEEAGYLIYRGVSMPYADNIKILNYKEFLERD